MMNDATTRPCRRCCLAVGGYFRWSVSHRAKALIPPGNSGRRSTTRMLSVSFSCSRVWGVSGMTAASSPVSSFSPMTTGSPWDLFSTSSSLCDASSTRVIFSATCSLTGDANSSLCCAGTDSNSSIISSARKGLSNRSVSLEVYSSATKSNESPTTSPKRK